jgi:hypothetical protein
METAMPEDEPLLAGCGMKETIPYQPDGSLSSEKAPEESPRQSEKKYELERKYRAILYQTFEFNPSSVGGRITNPSYRKSGTYSEPNPYHRCDSPTFATFGLWPTCRFA